jgi:hypothetical protein
MKKLVYIAGEPGSGKTTHVARPLEKDGLGFILHTDPLSARAFNHYVLGESFPNRWMSLWRHEFDDCYNKYPRLFDAFSRSMEDIGCRKFQSVQNVICEGTLPGHPCFRKIMLKILAQHGFVPDRVALLAIDPPWEQLQQNFIARGREKDQNVEFTMERSQDYKQRIRGQKELFKFQTSEECLKAARVFLEDESEKS